MIASRRTRNDSMLEMKSSAVQCIVLLAGVMLFARFGTSVILSDTACNALADAGDCKDHRLKCDNPAKIFPLRARQGFKPVSANCSSVISNCSTKYNKCCTFQESDCFAFLPDRTFNDIFEKCHNQTNCLFKALHEKLNCTAPELINPRSTYSLIEFTCIDDALIQNFVSANNLSGTQVALTYIEGSIQGNSNITCLVDVDDCSQSSSAFVVLYKTKRERVTNFDCTRLSLNGNDSFNCKESAPQFEGHEVFTPFIVRLHVVTELDASEAWTVIHGNTSLNVTCQMGNNEPSSSKCSSRNPNLQTEVTTATPGTTHTGRNPNLQTEATTATPGTTHTGLIAAVVVVIVVAIVSTGLALHCWRRRSHKRRPASGVGEPHADGYEALPLQASSSDLEGRYTSQRTIDGARSPSPKPAANITASTPASSPSTAAAAAASNVDYDHLGQMRPVASPHDVTYGHLHVKNDVTGDDYDHVGRFVQGSGSQNVIDNVYSTAGPAGSTSGFDDNVDYNVMPSVNDQRSDVISSPYDAIHSLT